MTKITLSICKVFKNSGSLRFHRKKTPKHWKHFFIDSDDGEFSTEWVNSIKARILKLKVHKIRKFICPECGLIFSGLVSLFKRNVECPDCL